MDKFDFMAPTPRSSAKAPLVGVELLQAMKKRQEVKTFIKTAKTIAASAKKLGGVEAVVPVFQVLHRVLNTVQQQAVASKPTI